MKKWVERSRFVQRLITEVIPPTPWRCRPESSTARVCFKKTAAVLYREICSQVAGDVANCNSCHRSFPVKTTSADTHASIRQIGKNDGAVKMKQHTVQREIPAILKPDFTNSSIVVCRESLSYVRGRKRRTPPTESMVKKPSSSANTRTGPLMD